RPYLFYNVKRELHTVQYQLEATQKIEYARADQGAAWELLARLYLNAEVYLGQGNGKYTEAITYASKVIDAGYSLMDQYEHLFMADNDQNNPEVIFQIAYDGIQTQNNGGTNSIIITYYTSSLIPTN